MLVFQQPQVSTRGRFGSSVEPPRILSKLEIKQSSSLSSRIGSILLKGIPGVNCGCVRPLQAGEAGPMIHASWTPRGIVKAYWGTLCFLLQTGGVGQIT